MNESRWNGYITGHHKAGEMTDKELELRQNVLD